MIKVVLVINLILLKLIIIMKLTNLFWGNTQGITLGVKIQKSQNSVKKKGGGVGKLGTYMNFF